MIPNRTIKVREIMTEAGLDAFVFFDLANIRYLCNFTGTDGALIVSPATDCFLSDSRYQAQAQQQVKAETLVCYNKKSDALIAELSRLNVKRVGVESETLTVAVWLELQQKAAETIEWVPVGKPLDRLRAFKDSDEIELLEKAALLNQQAFKEVEPLIAAGVSENEIALALEFSLKRHGGENKAFDFIVASGVRGAMPHGLASDKIIESGDLVTIDFGTRLRGYHSDETVTVAVGTIDHQSREIYDTVLAAHDMALDAVKPGMTLAGLDAVARDYIAEKGYGEFFGHGLGHGVGLEIHEYPALSPRSEGVIEEGMVITIEPGIYVPGIGGVRIEDTVVVTAYGCRCLTKISKTFRQFPA